MSAKVLMHYSLEANAYRRILKSTGKREGDYQVFELNDKALKAECERLGVPYHEANRTRTRK